MNIDFVNKDPPKKTTENKNKEIGNGVLIK
jgi:hypothetical protein